MGEGPSISNFDVLVSFLLVLALPQSYLCYTTICDVKYISVFIW